MSEGEEEEMRSEEEEEKDMRTEASTAQKKDTCGSTSPCLREKSSKERRRSRR